MSTAKEKREALVADLTTEALGRSPRSEALAFRCDGLERRVRELERTLQKVEAALADVQAAHEVRHDVPDLKAVA